MWPGLEDCAARQISMVRGLSRLGESLSPGLLGTELAYGIYDGLVVACVQSRERAACQKGHELREQRQARGAALDPLTQPSPGTLQLPDEADTVFAMLKHAIVN
jgi:hypothetical protein